MAGPRSSSNLRQRRSLGGSRREASDRITLRSGGFQTEGWTLNVSRGGVRVVLEDAVEKGSIYELFLGDDLSHGRRVRVVWVREQADGQIVGVQYLDSEGAVPPPEPPEEPPTDPPPGG